MLAKCEVMNEVIEKTEPEIARCSNCGAVLSGSFCFDCGQQDREVRRPFWRILRQLVHALLDLDGRVYRSMYYLYTRPGFLSSEYLSGRRANYTQPLRMFLVLSISFFLVVSIFGSINRLSSNPAEGPLAAINPELPGQQDAARRWGKSCRNNEVITVWQILIWTRNKSARRWIDLTYRSCRRRRKNG